MFPGRNAQEPGAASDEDEEEAKEEGDDLVRHSVKRLFACLSLGLLLGFTEHFEILQYVYDLHLWTDLGSKRNLGYSVPMRLMMAGASWSPVYWRRVQLGLVDLVRQVGFPQFFWTLRPRGEVAQGAAAPPRGRNPPHRARADANSERLPHGRHQRKVESWKDNVFHVQDPRGLGRRLHAFMRLEFQDGTRKLPSQDYHGSGRAHLHMIVFGAEELIRNLPIDATVSASLPNPEEDVDMHGYALGSQVDHKGDSGREIWEAPTCFDEEGRFWRLAHSEEDHDRGLRAYVKDVLDALKCHQDFLIGDDKASMLRRYITKYLSKFSDSASQDWLKCGGPGVQPPGLIQPPGIF